MHNVWVVVMDGGMMELKVYVTRVIMLAVQLVAIISVPALQLRRHVPHVRLLLTVRWVRCPVQTVIPINVISATLVGIYITKFVFPAKFAHKGTTPRLLVLPMQTLCVPPVLHFPTVNTLTVPHHMMQPVHSVFMITT